MAPVLTPLFVLQRFCAALLLVLLLGVPSAFAAPPTAPSNLTGYVFSSSSLVLLWDDNSTTESAFRITYTANGGSAQVFDYNPGTQASTGPVGVQLTVTAGVVYAFQIRAVNAGAEVSAATNTIGITTSTLGAPTALTAAALADGSVRLAWIDNAATEAGFFVESRRLPDATFTLLGNVGSNTISVNIPGADPAAQYEYRVRAFTGNPNSPTVTTAYAGPAPVTTAPLAAPSSLVATAAFDSPYVINLNWADNTTAEARYEIEYRPQGASAFVRRAVVGADATFSALPELAPGTIYEFRVCAINGAHVSAYSATATATTRNGFSSARYTPAVVGQPFSRALATNSQSPRTGWNATNLPAGLGFNNSTGVISGIPATAGVFFVPISATFANGTSHQTNLEVRVLAPPQVTTPIAAQTLTQGGSASIALGDSFASPGAHSALRLATTKGPIDLVLFASTPQTVANFLGYAGRGDYSNVFFHRAPRGFVLQGGGFRSYAAPDVFEHIPTVAPVQNEPGIPNCTGTVAMAKVGGDAHSATSEFFFNLNDNSANLDFQNGGFTVFARVSVPTFAAAVSTIAGLDRYDYAIQQRIGGTNVASSLADIPMDQAPAPSTMDQTKLVKITSATPIPVLTYAVTGSSQPAVASASIVGQSLQIQGLSPGLTNVSVTATDVDGHATTQTIAVEIRQTFAQWAAARVTNSAEAGAADNPDRDALNNWQEFSFLTDPNLPQTADAPVSFSLKPDGSGRFLEITFPVRKFAANLTYIVEGAATLSPADWAPIWTSTDGFAAPPVVGAIDLADRTVVTIRDTAASPAATARFLRVVLK